MAAHTSALTLEGRVTGTRVDPGGQMAHSRLLLSLLQQKLWLVMQFLSRCADVLATLLTAIRPALLANKCDKR